MAEGAAIGSVRLEERVESRTGEEVWRGRQPALDRRVLIRRLRADAPGLEEALRAARLAAAACHPNLVAVLDCFAAGGDHFLVSEHVDGRDLAEVLLSGVAPPRDAALAIALGLARGLAELHARRIVHGDLRADHVLLSRWGDVKLGGLDSVRRVEEGASDLAADVSALGAVGLTLFRGARPPRVLQRCRESDPARRPLARDVALALERHLGAAGELPGRFATAAWLFDAGARDGRDQPLVVPAAEVVRARPPARAFGTATQAAGVALLAALCVVGLLRARERGEPFGKVAEPVLAQPLRTPHPEPIPPVGAAPAPVEPAPAPVESPTPELEIAPVALVIPVLEPEPVAAPAPVAMESVEPEPESEPARVPAPPSASAFEVHYAPRPGETLADVAERAYGQEELAAWIAAENRLAPNARPGAATLRLPSASAHEVVAGETWGSLAAQSLGREDLGGELAALNGSQESAEPGVGEIVALPALVRVRLAAGDSLARVSRRFYGNPDQALLIARLNEIRDPSRVVPGQEVLVPVAHLVSLPAPASAPD